MEIIQSYLKISSHIIISDPSILQKLMKPLASQLGLKTEHLPGAGSKYRWYDKNKGRIDIFVPKYNVETKNATETCIRGAV